MTVRKLTAVFRLDHETEPPCFKAWKARYGHFNESQLCKRLCSPVLTPRDFKCYYRVLTRSLRMRGHDRTAPSQLCRLCGWARERLTHLPECSQVLLTFRPLRVLAFELTGIEARLDARFIYLGLNEEGFLKGSLSDLHIILWKFVMIAFVKVDVDGAKFKPSLVWKQALSRWRDRMTFQSEELRRSLLKLKSRGGGPPPNGLIEKYQRRLNPCAYVNEHGAVSYSDAVIRVLTELNL